MKPILSLAALFLVTPLAETIAYDLQGGETLLRTFEAHATYERSGIEIEVDGEELPDVEAPDLTMDSLERVVVRDEIGEAEGGQPTDFRRTFEELVQETSYESEDEEAEFVSGSDLEGITVRFLWDDEDETYYAELTDEDDDVDADTLEWLTADMDLAGFLPEGEVEEGESWDIDARPYLSLMWPSGLVGWYDTENEEGPSEFGIEQDRLIVENLEGEGTVTFQGVEEEEGLRLALLWVELEVSTEASGSPRDGLEVEVEMERAIEGTIRWDLTHGHLYDADLETDSEWSRTEVFPIEDEDGAEHEVRQTESQEGTIRYIASVERE
ncbi:MAG TPA: hypothetical protein ENJ09_03525 [Planctomycetes bacterium]|nr:hypothetical protein [Planctomycetota bacterium]